MPKGKKPIDLTNQKFGKWTALSWDKEKKKWLCRCDCGNERHVASQHLRNGTSKGCKVCAGREVTPEMMIGIEYGWLTPLRQADTVEVKTNPDGSIRSRSIKWVCRCRCGRETEVITSNLRNGHTQSCGECGYQEQQVSKALTTHGHTKGDGPSREYAMFCRAKERAQRKGLPFDIEVEDIVIPKHCPIFGFELEHNEDFGKHTSPSLDRIKPELGYTKANIWVISNKANTIKQDATLAELQAVANGIAKAFEERGWQ